MRRRWTEERRQNRIQAEWIVGWLRDNSPATIREIVNALEEAGRGCESAHNPSRSTKITIH